MDFLFSQFILDPFTQPRVYMTSQDECLSQSVKQSLNVSRVRRPAYLIVSLYWLVAMHIPWANSSDYGMQFPMNLLSWAVMCLLRLYTWQNNSFYTYFFAVTGECRAFHIARIMVASQWTSHCNASTGWDLGWDVSVSHVVAICVLAF
jgi:hypothetical protein